MSTLRLSEAIRLGAMLKPQAFHYFYDPVTLGTCAMGAAADAIGTLGQPSTSGVSFLLTHHWQETKDILVPCPACDDLGLSSLSGAVIGHLNDRHRWTRERIADWVETIERQQEAAQPAAQVEVSV